MNLLLISFAILFVGSAIGTKQLPLLERDPLIGSLKGALHVVTSTECGTDYFIFQSLTLQHTLNKAQQPGNFTRIVSCDKKELIKQEDMEIADTLVVPSWTRHPQIGDVYSPYNKPVGLMFWLEERRPTAEWTLIVDPDMQFRQPFIIDGLEIPQGYAMSSSYSYLKGVQNELAERHIPDVKPRNDSFGGPVGRKADQAGAYYLIRTRDLLKVAPLWMKFTENVRKDGSAWNLTGDQYVKPGGKAWISEMYGYVFAAAVADIWHIVDSTVQYYPGYKPKDVPLLIHYGLHVQLGGYSFDKHYHQWFNAFACPPWNMHHDRESEDDRGLFPHPPDPKSITTKETRERYGKLMIIEAVNTINAALCERHRKKCLPSVQLERECGIVDRIAEELKEDYEKLHAPGKLCYDEDEACAKLAAAGSCDLQWSYMESKCRASCDLCRSYISASLTKAKIGSHVIAVDETSTAEIHTALARTNEGERFLQPEIKTNTTASPQESSSVDSDQQKEALLSQYDAEKERVRCGHLNAAQLKSDAGCHRLIDHGYATVDDFPVLSVNFEAEQRTSNAFFYSRSLSIVAMSLLFVFACSRKFRSWRERTVLKLH